MPWGGVYRYDCAAVPRLGEHVSFDNDKVFVVVEIRHFPASNSVWINLRSTDGV